MTAMYTSTPLVLSIWGNKGGSSLPTLLSKWIDRYLGIGLANEALK